MGSTFKVSMFITSFIPLWLCILFIDILSLLDGAANTISEKAGIIAILLLNVFSIFHLNAGIRKAVKKDGGEFQRYTDVLITSARREKTITTEYLLSTVLPLFAFDFTLWRQVVLFLIYFITLSFLSLRNSNVYANLFFELKGYSFFNCTVKIEGVQLEDVIVLSKNNLQASIEHRISIVKLGYPLFMNPN